MSNDGAEYETRNLLNEQRALTYVAKSGATSSYGQN